MNRILLAVSFYAFVVVIIYGLRRVLKHPAGIWGIREVDMTTITDSKYAFSEENHVHTLNGKPLMGTTTLIKEVMPPMLAWYGSGMACKKLGWYDRKAGRANYLPDEEGMPILEKIFEEIKSLDPLGYLARLDEAYKAHDDYKKQRADDGTLTHAVIEEAVKEAILKNDGYLWMTPYENEAVERFAKWGRGKRFIYSEVHIYSEGLWVGGVLDLVYGENAKYYLADLKTSKSIYPSQFVQMGLYDYQQAENGFLTADGIKIGDPLEIEGYTVVNVPPNGETKAITYRGVKRLKEFAPNLVQLYQTLQELNTIIK